MSHESLQTAKTAMIRRQLQGRGIHNPRVLAAMQKVRREIFMPPAMAMHAYDDRALPINCGQSISQPYIVALMTEALELVGGEKILEIGTGSGYQTAVLAELGGTIFSIERIAELADQAKKNLATEGIQKVQIKVGDGTLGWPDESPFDRILVTAMSPGCPHPLFDQLVEGGILVIPVGDFNEQILQVIRKKKGRRDVTNLIGCRFVPLVGAEGWPEEQSSS